MGQCVSSSSSVDGTAGTSPSQPEPRCQAPGCQRARDLTSRSRYCAQHAVCKRQGCTETRYRKGPYCQEHLYTCRVSRCSNDQARVHDAWFTNNLCIEHQPEAVLQAYNYGVVPEAQATSGTEVKGNQQRARRRRSHQKPKPNPVPAPAPAAESRDSSDSSSESDGENAPATSHPLSTIGEEADGDDAMRPSIMESMEEHDDYTPGTPQTRRSQKTVHFADSPPRAASPERRPVMTADDYSTEPADPESAPQLRSSRHRRRVDGRNGNRPSPRTSSHSVTSTNHGREKRNSTGSNSGSSITTKTADVKRTTRPRSNR